MGAIKKRTGLPGEPGRRKMAMELGTWNLELFRCRRVLVLVLVGAGGTDPRILPVLV